MTVPLGLTVSKTVKGQRSEGSNYNELPKMQFTNTVELECVVHGLPW